MKQEFVSYEQAVALKELGFNEECLAWHNAIRLFIDNYDNYNSKMPFDYCCSLPLKQQVFRWLSLQLNNKDIMIPVDYEAQDKLINVLVEELKTKHLLPMK